MQSNLEIAFQLTVIGMSITFGAILLLWGLMALLTRLTAARREPMTEPAAPQEPAPEPAAPPDQRRRAAVAAVAVALARRQATRRHPPDSNAAMSPWQAAGRQLLSNRRGSGRSQVG